MPKPVMPCLRQDPKAPAFVQDPYGFYRKAREAGAFFFWEDYGLACTGSAAAVNAILRDRRFGREAPDGLAPEVAPHQAAFYAVENHSMLELEPPRHTRLRNLVLRAFTSRRIAELQPEIEALCDSLIAEFPQDRPFDLIEAYARPIPLRIIARLLGVPEERAPDLQRWSSAMVGMYQAGRSHAMECAAAEAATEFSSFLDAYIEARRHAPRDDLLSHLIAAESEGNRLSTEEMITTAILLLNAGHEATVHTIGNGIRLLLAPEITTAQRKNWLSADMRASTVEEILRFDSALHLFKRWVYEDLEVMGRQFRRGDQIALLLAMANRDPASFDQPDLFRPERIAKPSVTFGAGLHFCLGAPLARLELQIALPRLFARHPELRLAEVPRFADIFHFHGLESLPVTLRA